MLSQTVNEPLLKARDPSNPLFEPIRLSSTVELKHRIAHAPLTRLRGSKKGHVPIISLVDDYYGQRASTPGTLLITEATYIAAKAGGYDHAPGIWSEEQIQAWKQITDVVHKNGSFIYCQIWALGRSADPRILAEEGLEHVSSSNVPFRSSPNDIPRPLTKEEIREYQELYAQAAENAIKAGFDGVELHGANSYLIDQFISELTNKRTDEYGGSIENRSRFALEVLHAVSERIGAERTAIRLSPFSEYKEMKQPNPIPQFTHLISTIAKELPNLSYIHLIEPRVGGVVSGSNDIQPLAGESLDPFREAWRPTGRPFLVAGGYTPENALTHMREEGRENDVCVFGRWFIANPDLPLRIKNGTALNPYDRSSFYTPEAAKGYTDYPFSPPPVPVESPSRL